MSKIAISESRKQCLLDNFVEYSFEQDKDGEDLKADRDLFESISKPEEIYFIAGNVNWDDGGIIPRWIIDSPLCTKAAALMIFWTSAPDEYMEFEFGEKIHETAAHLKGQVDEEQTDILNMLEKLVSRFEKNDFYDIKFKFDFNYWGCRLIVNKPKWNVGEEFFESIDGIEVV